QTEVTPAGGRHHPAGLFGSTPVQHLALLVVISIVAGAGAAYVLYTRVHRAFRGYPGAEQFVDLPSGAGVRARRGRLRAAGAGPALGGYLCPAAHPLCRHTDAPKLVRLMTARFERAFTPALRAAADAQGLSAHQVVTLASMVEKETGRSEERPLVAAVYENRL